MKTNGTEIKKKFPAYMGKVKPDESVTIISRYAIYYYIL